VITEEFMRKSAEVCPSMLIITPADRTLPPGAQVSAALVLALMGVLGVFWLAPEMIGAHPVALRAEQLEDTMNLLRMMEIRPVSELVEAYSLQLQLWDWKQIRQKVEEHHCHVLGKRRELMPSQSEANLLGRPEEDARRDASFLAALCRVAMQYSLAIRSITGPDGERVIVAYLEGAPDDDLACFHDLEEWALCQQFLDEIESWDWAAIAAQAHQTGRYRLGRRQDLLPVDTYLYLDEQALAGMTLRGGMLMDVFWLAMLADVAPQYGLAAQIERDSETGEPWIELVPSSPG
jgi:hypothetical protein